MTDQISQAREELAPGSILAELAVDAAAIVGTGSITYGAWLIYHPAAFIIGGAFLLGGSWLAARQAGS